MRLISLVLLVISLAACGKPQEVLYVSTTQGELKKAPDPAAETARYANFGDVFKGKQRKDGWWRLFLDDGTSVYGKGAFSPYPIPSSELYVAVPATARFVTPDEASRDLSAKYRIGDKLTVARGMDWIPEGWGSVLEKGKPTGWVLLKALAPEQPTAAQLVDSAVASLRAGQYMEAIADAERAFVLDTRDKATLALVVSLHEARADAEAPMWRAKLGPAKKRVEPPVTVKKGDAFVALEEAVLLEKADDGATALAALAIATKVRVDELQGKWARVTWEGVADGERSIEVDPFAAAAPMVVSTAASAIVEGPPTTTGWMRASALSQDAPNREALQKRGLELARAGNHDEGFDLLIRAAAIPPADVAIWSTILDEAIKAKAWGPAARAALVRQQGGGSLGGFDVTLSVFYGCRGDRANAQELDADGIDFSQRIPVDACVSDLDPDECPPCDDYHDEHGYYEEGSSEEEESAEEESSEPETEAQRKEREEQERLAMEAEEAAAREREEAEAARQAELAAEAEAEAERQAERERWLSKLSEVFDSGHYVAVTVRNATATRSQAGQKLVYYEVPVTEGYNGGASYYTAQSLRTGVLTIPSLGPQESVQLWISVSSYRDVEWGVMATEDPDDVSRAISEWNDQAARNEPGYYEEPVEESEEESAEDAWEEPPHVSTSNLSPNCDCGGC